MANLRELVSDSSTVKLCVKLLFCKIGHIVKYKLRAKIELIVPFKRLNGRTNLNMNGIILVRVIAGMNRGVKI